MTLNLVYLISSILSIVIIGGMGNLKGSFYASVFMILLPEALRFVGMPSSVAANMRQIIYVAILVIVMMGGDKVVWKWIMGEKIH